MSCIAPGAREQYLDFDGGGRRHRPHPATPRQSSVILLSVVSEYLGSKLGTHHGRKHRGQLSSEQSPVVPDSSRGSCAVRTHTARAIFCNVCCSAVVVPLGDVPLCIYLLYFVFMIGVLVSRHSNRRVNAHIYLVLCTWSIASIRVQYDECLLRSNTERARPHVCVT